jgi:hypothetical protein
MREEAQRLIRESVDVEELKRKGESTEFRELRPSHVGNAVAHCSPAGTLGDIGREWILFAIFASPILGITGTYGWEIIADVMIA